MNEAFIKQVPLMPFNKSITSLLEYLASNAGSFEKIIVTDPEGKTCGILGMSYLYRKLNYGLDPNHVLEAICDKSFISISASASYVDPKLLINENIVVTGKRKEPLGLLDGRTMLLSYIEGGISVDSDQVNSFLNQMDPGVIFCSGDGTVEIMNPSARRMVQSSGLGTIAKITSLIPRFDLENLKKTYHLSLKDTYLEINSMGIGGSRRNQRIALILQDRTKEAESKALLTESRKKNKELLDIIDGVHDEIYVTDSNSVCILVNSACERIYDLKKSYMTGKSSAQMKKEGVVSSDIARQVIETRRPVQDVQTTRIGQKILVTANPIFSPDGNVDKVVINSREVADLTDIRVSLDKITDHSMRQTELDISLNQRNIVTESESMRSLITKAQKIASMDSSILITGESGTGKSLIAKLVHELSARHSEKLAEIDCSAMSGESLETELFGSMDSDRDGLYPDGIPGLIEIADRGTLILENVEMMPVSVQNKLRYTIKNREYYRGGTRIARACNVRFIAISSDDISQRVLQGTFNKDLYYSLNTFTLDIPPLRKRQEDIPVLMQNIINKLNKALGTNKSLSMKLIESLKQYPWPGNLTEMENILERLCIMSENDHIDHKSLELIPELGKYAEPNYSVKIGKESLTDILESVEENIIVQASRFCKTSYELADYLKISQPTANRKLRKYGIELA